MDQPREWLAVHHGNVPLIVSFPHSGTEIPPDIESHIISPWLARKDADHWIDVLYAFAHERGATTIRTALSRTVIDVNRDPAGVSLYSGKNTTALCPIDTFDGEPLYRPGHEPDAAEIERRRVAFFDPYHAALREQIARLRSRYGRVVLFDAHSIRSRVPRFFDGLLPQFNLGTHGGASCGVALQSEIERICDSTGFTWVSNGRFRGGWITRHYGAPADGVHAVQMELAMRGYLYEPAVLTADNWPAPLDEDLAAKLRRPLGAILDACIAFQAGRTS
jgi:N-formylglutamate deformylase